MSTLTLQQPLEEKSLWYKYKTEVWDQETPEAAAIHNIMRTLRSIRNTGEFAYVSVPITSGKILYENPHLTMQEVIFANYHNGWAFVEQLTKRLSCPILYPADLVPARQKWTQPQFQALWLSIIAEFATQVHMAEGWQFSTGGIEELIHVFQLRLGLPATGKYIYYNTKMNEDTERNRMKNIDLFDHMGKPLTISDSIAKIEKASSWIKVKMNNEYPPTPQLQKASNKLEESVSLLRWTEEAINNGFYQ